MSGHANPCICMTGIGDFLRFCRPSPLGREQPSSRRSQFDPEQPVGLRQRGHSTTRFSDGAGRHEQPVALYY
jgi:hypothetical protein